ncbi:unnamed protein product [Adineta ricciae]|uniref:Granulins domain-containing protein n=1 Tax=Adineta ricciae TaxID=249248 RepID=A0A813PL00_ADIRI|nr:unnamed protein product [Adineta ricciae]CAF0887789.1 unnamed protein product [Adineta ricciae]
MRVLTFILLCSIFVVLSCKSIDRNPDLDRVIVCPDGESICPSTSTCCIGQDGDYSCCPVEKGVCCADHIHCCPQHYKCDLKIFKCDRTFNAKFLGIKRSGKKN